MKVLFKGFIVFLLAFNYLYAQKFQFPAPQSDPWQKFELFQYWPDNQHGTVTDIVQDETSFIWIGCTNGLYRFDGVHCRKYINDWTPGSLPDNHVNDLALSPNGSLFIATKAGLCTYDSGKDCFVPVYPAQSVDLSSDTFNIRAILPLNDTLIWFDSQAGILSRMNPKNARNIDRYYHAKSSQPYYLYHSLHLGPDNNIWFGGRGAGPFVFKQDDRSFGDFTRSDTRHYYTQKRGQDAADFCTDSLGNFWMGNLSGLYHYDQEKDSMLLMFRASCWDIHASENGDLWFGAGNELARYIPARGQLITYAYNEDNPNALAGSYIHKIFEDNSGKIWVSTNRGLSICRPSPGGIQYYFHIPGMSQSIASNNITALENAGDEAIWIGTENKGIDYLDINTNEFRHYSPQNVSGMSSGNIRCFSLDSEDNLYTGFWSGTGFGKLNPTSHSFQNYAYQSDSRSSDWYNDLVFDENDMLYLGFWGGPGLSLFDIEKKEFSAFPGRKFNPAYPARLITCLHIDHDGRLWVGTTQAGLHLYLPDQDSAISYFLPTNEQFGIPDAHIYDISQCSNGQIYVAGDALYALNQEDKAFRKIELPSLSKESVVYEILCENDTTIWLLGNSGSLLFNPKTLEIKSMNALVQMEYDEGHASILRTPSGDLVFGGINGITFIHHEAEKESYEITPSLFFSQLDVFDQPKFHGIQNAAEYSLGHQENFFSVRMGGNFNDLHHVKLSYQLEGFNKEWKELSLDIATASFTNVPPGSYVFRSKIEKEDSSEILSSCFFTINIAPPFWLRWWFLSLIILTASAIIGLFIRNRFHAIRLRIDMAELNQKLLRLQMNPHFIFNSLFAIQNFIYSNQTHLAGKYLSDFAKLIRMILNNSRTESIPLEQELETIELYMELQKLRFSKKLEYTINTDPKLFDQDVFVPPMLAQPFIENAIEHGIKNIDRLGLIKINYALEGELIVFRLEDNGIGLKAAQKMQDSAEKKHISLATDIVKSRLNIIGKKMKKPCSLSIKEIKGEDGEVLGTSVVLKIPSKA